LGSIQSFAQDYYMEGQVSGWITVAENEPSNVQYGMRYIPSFSLETDINGRNFVDALISLNGYISGNADALRSLENGSNIRFYRVWARFAASQWEIRIGLQKINFGPAMLIRPLMWFDSLDPRDPLKLTTGVYALLLRYYFLNNANVWIWGLYGNAATKGWDFLESAKNKPEVGGRIQYPLGNGELAISYHYRRFAFPQKIQQIFPSSNTDAPEHRIGLDGKWDYEVGFWFEGSYQYQKSDFIPTPHQLMMTYGLDYTFNVGNGINIILENFLLTTSELRFSAGPTIKWSSLSVNYPVSLFDQSRIILFYDWKNQNTYSFISWQRSYDNWVLYLNLFWNPDQTGSFDFANQSSSAYAGGKGFQDIVVINH